MASNSPTRRQPSCAPATTNGAGGRPGSALATGLASLALVLTAGPGAPLARGADATGAPEPRERGAQAARASDDHSAPIPLFHFGNEPSKAGEMYSPEGIALGREDSVYVADRLDHRIQHFTDKGELITTWGAFGAGQGELAFPDAIAVGPDGNVIVVDSGNLRLQRFSGTGRFLSAWPAVGRNCGDAPADPAACGPSGIAVAPDGRIFVTIAGTGEILVLNPLGVEIGRWSAEAAGPVPLSGPRGLAASADSVYVADFGNSRIVAFNLDGSVRTAWGSAGTGPTQFNGPWAVAVATDLTILVADQGNHRIVRFSPDGEPLGRVGSWGLGPGELDLPAGVVADSQGRIFVADSGNRRVQLFSGDGRFQATWGQPGGPAGLWEPAALTFDRADRLLVADPAMDRVALFTPIGVPSGFLASPDLVEPGAVAVTDDGTLVADSLGGSLHRFDSSGAALPALDLEGPAPGRPEALADRGGGSFALADGPGGWLGVFRADGSRSGFWASPGTLAWPAGLTGLADGGLGVVERHAGQVRLYGADGAESVRWGVQGDAPGRLAEPQGLAEDSAGNILVADWPHRLQAFSRDGRHLWTTDAFGPELGQFDYPADVVVSGGGWIYVADPGNHRVQVLAHSVPEAWRATYFANPWLAGAPAWGEELELVQQNWGLGSPRPGVPADGFSARFERYLSFSPGAYRITLEAAGGTRFWIGRRLVIDAWDGSAGDKVSALVAASGFERVRLEYADRGGPAAVALRIEAAGDLVSIRLPWTGRSGVIGRR